MQKLSLSIIIPVYNEEHYLERCLKAIAAQTEMPDEVIVVDNNSTDGSLDVAKKFSFVTILHEKTQGVVFARDTGFDAATSDLIGRIDADTLLPPHWVQAVKKLLADEHYAAANGPVFYYDMPNSPRNYWIDHQVRKHLYRGAPKAPFLFGSNSAIRKTAWQNVRGEVCHARTMHEDLDLAIHLMLAGLPIRYDKTMLAGTSARRYDDRFKQWQHYMTMYLHTYDRHGLGGWGPRVATLLYWTGYLGLQPLMRAYDPVTDKRQLKNFAKKRRKARKNPMSDN